MRVAVSILISLAAFLAVFTATRLAGVLGGSALFDWTLIAAVSALAVYLSSPLSVLKSLILFVGTAAAAVLLAFVVSYAILGDSL